MTWRDACRQLDGVPGLIVRGDGTGLCGGTGYVSVDGHQRYKDPWFIRQELDGGYCAEVTIGVGPTERKYGDFGAAVAFVVQRYTESR